MEPKSMWVSATINDCCCCPAAEMTYSCTCFLKPLDTIVLKSIVRFKFYTASSRPSSAAKECSQSMSRARSFILKVSWFPATWGSIVANPVISITVTVNLNFWNELAVLFRPDARFSDRWDRPKGIESLSLKPSLLEPISSKFLSMLRRGIRLWEQLSCCSNLCDGKLSDAAESIKLRCFYWAIFWCKPLSRVDFRLC